MAGPNYTIAQTRARVAAIEICCLYLTELRPDNEADAKQWDDIRTKLNREIAALKEKAQRTRAKASRNNRPL